MPVRIPPAARRHRLFNRLQQRLTLRNREDLWRRDHSPPQRGVQHVHAPCLCGAALRDGRRGVPLRPVPLGRRRSDSGHPRQVLRRIVGEDIDVASAAAAVATGRCRCGGGERVAQPVAHHAEACVLHGQVLGQTLACLGARLVHPFLHHPALGGSVGLRLRSKADRSRLPRMANATERCHSFRRMRTAADCRSCAVGPPFLFSGNNNFVGFSPLRGIDPG